MAREHTDLLIVGAGPFGLAMAAHASVLGVEHIVLGRPMSFWREHMPAGMLLRSGADWHLDPAGRHTIERFLEWRGIAPSAAEPLSLDLYLEYASWFAKAAGIHVRPALVTRLAEEDGMFETALDGGDVVTARRVLLALGFGPFAHVPAELAEIVPEMRLSHSCDLAAPADHAGRRVLVVGGRQSAFESAALLAEAGATAVHVCHRHDTPAFAPSDWSWVGPLLERMEHEPGWFRRLPDDEREELAARFWREGRLKLEPWLGERLRHPVITIRPNTRVVGCEEMPPGLRVALEGGEQIDVDHVLCATGYQVDLARVPFLAAGGLLDRIEQRDGSPVLDDTLQTTVPDLFMTSLPAARDFGPFFAFTVSVRTSARIVGRALGQ